MKKFIPVLLFIMAFSGFLSTQILWDTFNLNAKQVSLDGQKHLVYEQVFQTLKLTGVNNEILAPRDISVPIVVLNFWASWCTPCLQEFPSLVKFQEKYKGQVVVVGINGDEEEPVAKIQQTKKKYKLNFESYLDPNSVVGNKFYISSYPVSIVFHKGKVIFESKKVHNFMSSSFLELIEKSLKAN